jgi:hypothetical protein
MTVMTELVAIQREVAVISTIFAKVKTTNHLPKTVIESMLAITKTVAIEMILVVTRNTMNNLGPDHIHLHRRCPSLLFKS